MLLTQKAKEISSHFPLASNLWTFHPIYGLFNLLPHNRLSQCAKSSSSQQATHAFIYLNL